MPGTVSSAASGAAVASLSIAAICGSSRLIEGSMAAVNAYFAEAAALAAISAK